MITEVQSQMNFGAARYIGTDVQVSGKAKKLFQRLGQEAVDAADTFVSKNKVSGKNYARPTDPNPAEMTVGQRVREFFSTDKDGSYWDLIKIFVRPAKESSNGQPTLAMKYHRNVSGKELGYSTQELPILSSESAESVQQILTRAQENGRKVADTAHDAWAIGTEKLAREGRVAKAE